MKQITIQTDDYSLIGEVVNLKLSVDYEAPYTTIFDSIEFTIEYTDPCLSPQLFWNLATIGTAS